MLMDLSALTKQERGRLHHCLMKWSDLKRIAAGLCRHCGEGVPCWSPYGDQSPGVRHTTKTYSQEYWLPSRRGKAGRAKRG